VKWVSLIEFSVFIGVFLDLKHTPNTPNERILKRFVQCCKNNNNNTELKVNAVHSWLKKREDAKFLLWKLLNWNTEKQ
jgi:hypothetical protein